MIVRGPRHFDFLLNQNTHTLGAHKRWLLLHSRIVIVCDLPFNAMGFTSIIVSKQSFELLDPT